MKERRLVINIVWFFLILGLVFDGSEFLFVLTILNLWFKVLFQKDLLKVTKSYPTKCWILWMNSELTKIHDLGMDWKFFVLRFLICVRGVRFGIRGVFSILRKWGFLWRVCKFGFEVPTFKPIFKIFNFNIQYFDVKNISSESQKVKKRQKNRNSPITRSYGRF